MDRKHARIAAMKLLYEWAMGGDGGRDTLEGLLEIQPGENETDYMEALIEGVKGHAEELDALIEQYAIDWRAERLRKVDLTILRVAAYELVHTDLPTSVAISEAVEMARAYSTPESVPFINGVLGNMARAIRAR